TLAWRPPFDGGALLGFLALRQIHGVEHIDAGPALSLRRTLRLTSGNTELQGWLSLRLDLDSHRAHLQVSESLLTALPAVIWRVRGLLDLDADPSAINATLHDSFPAGDGLRVPGCVD